MAENIQSTIRINVDTSQALSSIKLLQSQISAFQTQMARGGAAQAQVAAGMQQNLVNSINATGKFQASLKTVQTSTESFSRALQANKLSMGEYFRYAGGASKTFGRLFTSEFNTMNKVARERVKDLQTQYIKMGRDASGAMKAIAVRPLALDMDNLATKTAIAAQKQQLLNQLLRQGSTNLLNWGKNTQWAGRQLMVGFTVPLMMLGTAAAKTYMQLETASIKLRRVYGDLSTTESETRKIAENVKQIGSEFTQYGIAVSDTMDLAAQIAATGKQGQELLTQVRETTRMAALGGIDQNKAMETTISLTNAFGIASKDLADNVNFLNFTQNQTILSLDDMTTAIPKAAPVVQQLGGNVKDLAFFLTAMKEGGINAAQGANAIKSGLASIINPTKQASEFLAKFNINLGGIVTANKGNIKQTVIELGNALNKLDPLNRAQAIEKLFGKFQFARMSALLKNVTDANSQASMVSEIGQKSKAELSILAERELKRVSDSPMMKFQKAVADLKVTLVPLGEQFLKAVTPIAKFLKDVLTNFNKMDDGFKSFLTNMTIGVAGFGPIALMVVGLVANGVANIIKLFVNIKSFFNNLGKSNQALGEQTNYLTEAQLNEKAVAASLDQVHNKLRQTFTSEAESVGLLIGAYERATIAQRAFMGAGVPRGPIATRLATGGIVRGPGTGTSDEIPAMLSNGEAVIPAASVARNPALVSSLISGQIAKYSIGGYVSSLGRNPNAPSAEIARTDAIQMGHLRDGVKMTIAEIIQSVEVLGDQAVAEIRAKLALEEKRMRAAGVNPATTKLTAFTEAVIRQPQAINNLGNKAFDASVAKKAYIGTGGEIYDNYARHMQNAGMSAEEIKKVLDKAAAEMQISLGALDDKAQLTVVDLGKMAESALEVAVSGDNLSKQEQIAKQTIARVSQTRMSWTEFGTTNNRKGMRDSYKFNAEKNEKIATQIFGPRAAYGAGTGKARPDVDMMARNGVQYSPRAVTQSLSNLQFLGGKYEAAANELISELNRTKKSPVEFRAAIQKLDRTLMEASDGAFNLSKMENELAAKMKSRTITTQSGKSSQAVATEKAFGIQSPSREEIKIATDRVAGFKQGMQTAVKEESQSGRALGTATGEAFGLAAKTAAVATSKQLPRFFGPQSGMAINTSNATTYVKPVPTPLQVSMANAKANLAREGVWLKEEWQQIINPMKTALSAAKTQISEDAMLIKVSAQKAFSTIVPESSAMGQAFQQLKATMTVARGNFMNEWQWIKEDFLGGTKAMKAGAVDIEAEMTRAGKIFNTTSRIAQYALAKGDMTAVLTKKSMSAVSGFAQPVINAQKNAWETLASTISKASKNVIDFGTNAATAAGKAVTGARKALSEASASTANAMKQAWYKVNPTAGIRSQLATQIAFAKAQKETITQTIANTRLKSEESKAIVQATMEEKRLTEARIAELQAMLRGENGMKQSVGTKAKSGISSLFDSSKGSTGKMGVGMGLTMLPMAMSMSGDKKMQEVGNQLMMPAMAAGMALQMIPGPAGWVAAGLIGLVTVVNMSIAAKEKENEAAFKLGKAMTATQDKVVKFSEITKTVSATQARQESQRVAIAGMGKNANVGFGSQFLNSAIGKSLLSDVQAQRSAGKTGAEIGQNMANQLGYQIAQGTITTDQAKSIALALGNKLKDQSITATIVGQINSIFGPNGENILKDPINVVIQQQQSTQRQTAQVIDTSKYLSPEQVQQTNTDVALGKSKVSDDWLTNAFAQQGAMSIASSEASLSMTPGGQDYVNNINKKQVGLLDPTKMNAAKAAMSSQLSGYGSLQGSLDIVNQYYDKQLATAKTEAEILVIEGKRKDALQQAATANQAVFDNMKANRDLLNRSGGNYDTDIFKPQLAAKLKGTQWEQQTNDFIDKINSIKDPDLKLRIQGQVVSGDLSPDFITKITDMQKGSKGAEFTQAYNLSVTTNGDAMTAQVFSALANHGANTTITIEFLKKDPQDVLAALDALDQVNASTGIVIDINSAEGSAALTQYTDALTKLRADAAKGPIKHKTILDVVGGNEAAAKAIETNEYFKKASPQIKIRYIAEYDALLNLQGALAPAYQSWLDKHGWTKSADKHPFTDFAAELAGTAVQTTAAAGDTPYTPPGNTPAADKPTDLKGQVAQDIANNKLQATLQGKKYNKDFIDMMVGADKKTQEVYTRIDKTGRRVLNAKGIALAKAYDTKILGAFWNKQNELITSFQTEDNVRKALIKAGWDYTDATKAAADADIQAAYAAAIRTKSGKELDKVLATIKAKYDAIKAGTEQNTLQKAVGDFYTKNQQGLKDAANQTTAITKLVAAGISYTDALEIVKDTTLANAIATDTDNKTLADAIKMYKELKKVLEDAKTPAEKFQDAFDKASAQLDNERNKKELAFKLDPNIIAANATIANANDAIAKNQYVIDQYNAGLTKISQQEELINKKYDDRTKALEKVSAINQEIADQEKGKISLAEALAKGDISAAAKAMADIRAKNAQYAVENKKKAIEEAKQKELDNVQTLVNGKMMTRKEIEDQVKVLENNILDIQQNQLAPATELVRLKQVQLDKDLVLIDLEKARWDSLNTQINDAKNGVYDYTKALIAAQDLANNAYKQYLNPNTVPGTTPTTPTTTPTTTPAADARVAYTYDPTLGYAVPKAGSRVVTWTAYRDSSGVYYTTLTGSEKATGLYGTSQSGPSAAAATKQAPTLTKAPAALAFLPQATLNAMGYYAAGGFAKGTDTIPAMLTPGEFVVRKYAVDSFGVDNLKAINNGTYNGESVYNYNLSVSLNGSNMNANDVADVVMSKIKQIDSQRIRGNRL